MRESAGRVALPSRSASPELPCLACSEYNLGQKPESPEEGLDTDPPLVEGCDLAEVLPEELGVGQAMGAGAHMATQNSACVSWPTGEFGPMGLEGQVNLVNKNELAEAAVM